MFVASFIPSFLLAPLILLILRYAIKQLNPPPLPKGCKPPCHIPSGFLGTSIFQTIMKAGKEGRYVPWIDSLLKEHRYTLTMNVLTNEVVLTADPENMKALLATQFKDFSLGLRNAQLHPLLGDGIFTEDGEAWAHSRALLRPQFTRDQISDLEELNKHVLRLIDTFPKDSSPFDIHDLFFLLTLDSSTEFLFGESVGSLIPPNSEEQGIKGGSEIAKLKKAFPDAMSTSQNNLVKRTRSSNLYWLHNSSEFKEANKLVHQLVDYYVDRALATSQEVSSEKGEGRYIFLEALALETRDRKMLRDQLLNILLAGRDTTAGLLASIFYLLARSPESWRKLRNEIVEAFGEDRETRYTPETITFASLKSLKYLHWVIEEALRLFPAVPLNGRQAVNDTTLPVGGGPDGKSPISIKKGQDIWYSTWTIHRREDIWGPDAAEFRPERWGESPPRGWNFIPFNGGPRICLGQQYATIEASYVIVKLLQRFDILENADEGVDMGTTPTLAPAMTLGHDNGVRVRLYCSKGI